MTDDTAVGLVNLPLHIIFRQVDMTFQQTPLSHTGTNYPYKAYIDTILITSKTTQEGLLTSQLFYKDLARRHRMRKRGLMEDCLTEI